MIDHDYDLKALREVCNDGNIADIEVDEKTAKEQKVNMAHTPVKGPKPKKCKSSNSLDEEKKEKRISMQYEFGP